MSELKHTPEPWRVIMADDPDAYMLYGDTGDCIAEMPSPDRQGVEHSNPYRIVACVNACAGMEDPEKEITKLRADQQVLVDALERIDIGEDDYLSIVREALAKVQAKEATDGQK